MTNRFATLAGAIVLVHLVVSLAHGWAHVTVPVPTSPAQNAVIVSIIGIAPPAAAALLLRGRMRAGAWLLALSMLGALAFGVVCHYVADSPDHVARVPRGVAGAVFRSSALGLALTELAGAVVGFWGVARARTRAGTGARQVAPAAPRW